MTMRKFSVILCLVAIATGFMSCHGAIFGNGHISSNTSPK